MELNDYGMQQRRLAHMRFLGELYSYKHIDSSVVFETLYLIIVFGHGTPEVSKSLLQIFFLNSDNKPHCAPCDLQISRLTVQTVNLNVCNCILEIIVI